MPFQPGQSGNPGGKRKAKPFSDALMLALKEDEVAPARQRTKLDRVVTALLDKAFEGDVPALKEVADRIDGKVPQGVIGGDEDDNPINIIQRIELVAAKLNDDTKA